MLAVTYSVVDLERGEVFATLLLDHPFEGAADPWGVVATPDGSTLWITISGVHQLARIDLPRLHEFLAGIKLVLLYLDVSNCNMEEGSLRCDVNISIRNRGDEKFGEKVEIKNLNSFKAVRASINYEIERQIELIESGKKSSIVQETRLWNTDKNETDSIGACQG